MSREKSWAVAEPTTAFIDTNLLIRYFVKDDTTHARAAHRLLEQAARGEVSLVVAPIVFAEITWVLESHFSLSLDTIADYLEAILQTPGLTVLEAEVLSDAVGIYRRTRIDFVDAWIASLAKSHEISRVYTFDRRHFARVPGLEVLTP